jgi:hypothetical protein
VCDGRHKAERDRVDTKAALPRGALEAQTLDRRYGDLLDARDDHLLRLTDSTGMLQHATFTIPNYRHGYCTDEGI